MGNYSKIFDEAMSYESYREMVSQLLEQGKTTGPDHSEAMLHYTKMNNQRMNRVEKTTVLTNEVTGVIDKLTGRYHLLVLSEGWCGDAAQILPIIYKIVTTAPDHFKLRIILRDQNLDIMDQHLTNGGRAIPVLLVLDENNNQLLPKWGPRPSILQELLVEWRKEEVDYAIIAEKIHSWYAKDRTLTTQHELAEVLSKLV